MRRSKKYGYSISSSA
jgi:hypothetical protein